MLMIMIMMLIMMLMLMLIYHQALITNNYLYITIITPFSHIVLNCTFSSMCDGLCGGNEKGYPKIRKVAVAESQVE